jgi:hypothetical protein
MIILHTNHVTASTPATPDQINLNLSNRTDMSNQNWTDNNRRQTRRG